MRWRRISSIFLLVIAISLYAMWAWSLCMAAAPQCEIAIYKNPALRSQQVQSNYISLMVANVAHGRGNGRHQLKQSEAEIIAHLDAVQDVFTSYAPDIICLQEVDEASWWSGGFSHIQYIAANNYHAAHAKHVDGLGLHYGTGILSRFDMAAAWAYTFDPTPPTMSKGFTLAKIACDHARLPHFYVVSLHTDFASSAARAQQLATLQEVLSGLDAPYIVAGDFNCDFNDAQSPLPAFLRNAGLKTYQADSQDQSLVTFRSLGRRIDWICIPQQWSFQSFHVLQEIVSDHSLIVANIAFPHDPVDLSH